MIHPLYSQVFIEPIGRPEVATPSGLVVVPPDDALRYGKVLAVGPGREYQKGELVPPPVTVGQTVMYAADRYTIHAVPGGFLIDASDLLAVITA